MNFQTKLPLSSLGLHQIDYGSKILLLGSCFSENIGEKFSYYKFQHLINPFGILFHPLAIEKFISVVINKKEYSKEDIFYLNDRYHCYDVHSRLSEANEENLVENLNKIRAQTFSFIEQASHVIITLGTAWAYRHKESKQYVANCHKVPQKQFSKQLLSVGEISESLKSIVNQITQINSKVKFIFTVSPVRHIKDGFEENMRSKAHVLLAIHNYLEYEHNKDKVGTGYFPSYEIMMDELRDYRFYKYDMLHPNDTAIDYIWERFQKVYISDQTKLTMEEVADIQKGLNHRPVNPISAAHQTFLQKLDEKQKKLTARFDHIQF